MVCHILSELTGLLTSSELVSVQPIVTQVRTSDAVPPTLLGHMLQIVASETQFYFNPWSFL